MVPVNKTISSANIPLLILLPAVTNLSQNNKYAKFVPQYLHLSDTSSSRIPTYLVMVI